MSDIMHKLGVGVWLAFLVYWHIGQERDINELRMEIQEERLRVAGIMFYLKEAQDDE